MADLPALLWCNDVVKEALRLYPPTWLISRAPLADWSAGEFRIPEATTIFLCPWVMHRDPRFFDAAEEFHPERWAGGLAQRLPRFAYFPFGGGPRGCLGSAFASLEIALALATIVPRFDVIPVGDEPIVPRPGFTLRPDRPIAVKVVRRGAPP